MTVGYYYILVTINNVLIHICFLISGTSHSVKLQCKKCTTKSALKSKMRALK